jgi:hypothetical protein
MKLHFANNLITKAYSTTTTILRRWITRSPASSIRVVSDILKMAFEKASKLTSESEQDVLARWLLDALDQDEKRWDKAFADSSKKLESIADEVLEGYRHGRTNLLTLK